MPASSCCRIKSSLYRTTVSKLAALLTASGNLPPAVIVTAFGLQRFLESNHKWAREISAENIQLVAAITASSRCPFLPAPSTRDIGPGRPATAEPVGYPADWATNITKLRRDVQEFRELTAAYRDSQAFLSFIDPRLAGTRLSSTDSEYESGITDAPHPPRYFNTGEPSSGRRPLSAPTFVTGPSPKLSAGSLEPPTTGVQPPKLESSPRAPSFSPITRQNTPADQEPHSAEAGSSNTRAFKPATLRRSEPPPSFNLTTALGSKQPQAAEHHRPAANNFVSPPPVPQVTRETTAEEAIYPHPIGPEPAMAQPISPAVQAAIDASQAATNANMEAMFQRMENLMNRRRSPPPNPPTPPTADFSQVPAAPKFNPKELGFLDPTYGKKSAAEGGALENTAEGTIYRDVHIFISRANDFVRIFGAQVIRDNLFRCLKGEPLKWHTYLLSDGEKRLLTMGDNLNEWTTALTREFREKPARAMELFSAERYTMADAAQQRSPRDYAQNIISLGQSAELPLYNQMLQIWNGLDADFQFHVRQPSESTSLAAFLKELDDKKDTWHKYALRYHSGKQLRNDRGEPRSERRYNERATYNERPAQPFRPSSGNAQRQYAGADINFRPGLAGQYQNTFGQRQPSQQSSYQQQRYQQPTYQQQPVQQQFYQRPAYQPAYQREQPAGYQPAASYQPSYQPAYQPAYQRQQPASGQQQQQALPAPPAFKQITAGPAMTPTADADSQQPRTAGNKRSQRAYLGDAAYYQHEVAPDGYDENGYYEDRSAAETTDDGAHQYEAAEPADTTFQHEASQTSEDSEDPSGGEEAEVNFAMSATPVLSCRRCSEQFQSNNKLHRHLKQCRTPDVDAHRAPNTDAPIIDSRAPSDISAGYSFRPWKYARLQASLAEGQPTDEVCVDSGTTMTIGDRQYIRKKVPGIVEQKTAEPIRVRGIGAAWHDTSSYVMLDFYVPGIAKNSKPAIAHFKREVHLVDDLSAKILIGVDTMVPEEMVIDAGKQKITIGSCGITAKLDMKSRGQRVDRTVRALQQLTIPPHTHMAVPVKIRGKQLPDDRDYSFLPADESRLGTAGGFFAHITDAHLTAVQVRNSTNEPVIIPKNKRVGRLQDFEEEGCFLASTEDRHLAVKSSGWLKKAAKWATAGIAGLAAVKGVFHTTSASVATSAIDVPRINMETVMPNGITVYGDQSDYNRLSTVAEAYPTIWGPADGVVKVPEDQWMSIPTLPDAKPTAAKVYPLNPEDRQVVDEEFDRLHRQGKMSWTSGPTPYAYPVFVVWRTVQTPDKPPERKGRVVVDIRGLNKISMFDAYPMTQQSDLLSAVIGCPYISVMDAASFFHQWLVRLADRHKLTVVSHRGSEQWNVAVMGYRNSTAYVQRQIDGLLRKYKHFARAYVDDVVVFSQSLEEHLRHLNQIFALFAEMNIVLKPAKTFLGYPSVSLLGQKVDSLGMTTTQEKLEAILSLRFPQTFKHLEAYLGKTGYLRQYVSYYAQKADSLQQRKTRLLKDAPVKGQARKKYSARTLLTEPSSEELDSFNQLQSAFSRASFLVHFDSKRGLFIDVDASKERGFGVTVYHIKDVTNPENITTPPSRTALEPIMFLSKMLSTAEKNYWPTELEMAGLIWAVRKLRLMISSSDFPVTIFTDHGSNPAIVAQTKLTSSSVDRLNLKLVRASMYLSQFRIRVFHRSGKSNIIPDALSRLPTVRHNTADLTVDSLDIDGFNLDTADNLSGTLVQMADDFRSKLITGYTEDPTWKPIRSMLIKLHAQTTLETEQHQLSTEALVGDKSPNEASEVSTRKQSFAVVVPSKVKRPIVNATSKQLRPRPVKTATSQGPGMTKESSGSAVNADDPPTSAVVKDAETKRVSPLSELKGSTRPTASNKNSKSSSTNIKSLEVLATQKQTAPTSSPLKLDAAYVASGINFQLIDDLIYHIKEGTARLCIPANCIQDIFQLAHDQNAHAGHHRAYARLVDLVYIRKLSRQLTTYIKHCPKCQLNQTTRHKPYGSLTPISSTSTPYYTISIDFILALPKQNHGFDAQMTVTDKCTRKHLLISGKSTDSAKQWADKLLDALQRADWGVPCEIISDRDPKFVSDIWEAIFKRLDTKLLMATAYHAQTDGQSERTNQVVEIALRFLIAENPDVDWNQALPALQLSLNNSINAATGHAPNEVALGFKPREVLTAIATKGFAAVAEAKTNFAEDRFIFRKEASDATSFANAKSKIYYDVRHTPLLMKSGDFAYLTLNRGYRLPSQPNRKLSQQRCGPFLIKRRVGRLAYELELPPAWRVHPVVSVAQLEPAPAEKDPYQRDRPHHPDEVEVEEIPSTEYERNYEVEKIVNRRTRKFGRTLIKQYLVRWLGYGPEYDEWKPLSKLGGCLQLIEAYDKEHPS